MAGIQSDFAHDQPPRRKSVSISRKDTIIIAMLVNIALLAVLFATASRTSSTIQTQSHVAPIVKAEEMPRMTPVVSATPVVAQVPVDEIDELLKAYANKAETEAHEAPVVVTAQLVKPEPAIARHTAKAEPVIVSLPVQTTPANCIEIKVKKGDVLSKLAKQHGVKVEEIVVLNSLDSAKLKIGQTLKIPKASSQTLAPATDVSYYVVQSGDSPWKIAKKCSIKVEDLLRLNNLDEEKARNLKIGQKLRIR